MICVDIENLGNICEFAALDIGCIGTNCIGKFRRYLAEYAIRIYFPDES